MAANSSGSRKCESKLKLEAAAPAAVEDGEDDVEEVTALVVDDDVVTDGETGQEDVEMCFGGRGTLRGIGKLFNEHLLKLNRIYLEN